jgi:dolichyl-phosphate beta-glucosyltransferase
MDAHSLHHERHAPVTSLVFPAFNPGAVLGRIRRQVEQFLREAPDSWEVLFVCDGCTDGTPALLADWARRTDRIRVLCYSPNRGKGYAVRCGLQAARGDWRVFTDVDLAYSLEDVMRLAEVLRGGADVAIGSRTHPDSEMVLPTRLQGYAYRRHLQSMAFSALVRWLLPLTQRDTQAGLKGLSARAAGLVLPHLSCDGFGFDCELLTACVRHGLTIREVPVRVRYEDRASTTNLGAMARMFKELWRIRRTWRLPPPTVSSSHVEPGRRAA